MYENLHLETSVTPTAYEIVHAINKLPTNREGNSRLKFLFEILSNFFGYYMNEYEVGITIGKMFHSEHRTGQASFCRFLFGVIVGISKQSYTDARNETPINTCKQIAEKLENGEYKIGYMI